jgi:hypothetical protein
LGKYKGHGSFLPTALIDIITPVCNTSATVITHRRGGGDDIDESLK